MPIKDNIGDSAEFYVDIDPECHSIKAITFATNELAAVAIFRIENTNSGYRVYIKSKNASFSDKQGIISSFFESIVDHEVRIALNKEFGAIRDILVAQAFQPCDNLKQILNETDND